LALLALELERAVARGDQFPEGLLEEVRGALRESGQPASRAGDPTRVFFAALEPFLINDDAGQKRPGRIARAVLSPMWSWICRDLVPAEAKTYNAEAARAAADPATYEQLARGFRDCVVAKMESVLASAKTDARVRRLIGQIGTQNALDDARGLLTIFSAADIFAQIEKSLPVRPDRKKPAGSHPQSCGCAARLRQVLAQSHCRLAARSLAVCAGPDDGAPGGAVAADPARREGCGD